MKLESLEKFVMDTIDVILANPEEYEAEAVKSTIAYRFELHRQSLQGGRPRHHPLRPPYTEIKINIIPRKDITTFITKADQK